MHNNDMGVRDCEYCTGCLITLRMFSSACSTSEGREGLLAKERVMLLIHGENKKNEIFFFTFYRKNTFFNTGQHDLYANTSPTNKYPIPWQVRPCVLMLYHKTIMGSLKMAIIIIVVVVIIIVFSVVVHTQQWKQRNEFSKTKVKREVRAGLSGIM